MHSYGIAFFGTPHRGGNLATLGSVAASIARFTLRNPKNTFLKALKRDSLFADDLVQDFRQQLENYHVLSFFETQPLSPVSGLVSCYALQSLLYLTLTMIDRGPEIGDSGSPE